VEAESESVVPETASCEMASAKRVKAPLLLLQGRGGVAFCHLDDLTGSRLATTCEARKGQCDNPMLRYTGHCSSLRTNTALIHKQSSNHYSNIDSRSSSQA
jgi:hypothetical protein